MRINEKGEFEIFDELAEEQKEYFHKILEIAIEDLGLSIYTLTVLHRTHLDIKTVGDLVSLTPKETEKILRPSEFTLATRSYCEIKEKLKTLGLSLNDGDRDAHTELQEDFIGCLDLSPGISTALRRAKIYTIKDLMNHLVSNKLFEICKIDKCDLNEVIEKLHKVGSFSDSVDNQVLAPQEIINNCLSKMSSQEKKVIILLYGLDKEKEHSYEEICERFNITVPGIISAIDSHFLDTLRKQDEFINKEFLQELIKNSDLNPYKKIVENLFNQSIDELLLSRYNIILKSDEDIHNEALFDFEEHVHFVKIKRYIGFRDEKIVVPSFYNNKPVREIGESAFENCSFIREVIITSDVLRFIRKRAFMNCSGLKKVYANCINLICESAFDGCEELEVFHANSVWNIGSCAFNECICLCKFDVGNGNIRTIGDSAFFDCQCLREIPSLKNVAIIGNCAFDGCSYIKDVILGEDLKHIGDNAFCGTTISNVYIPENVKYIGELAFGTECESLNVYIYSENAEIGEEAFCHKASFGENHQENLVVYCKPNSTAQMYCRKNGITHKKLET